MFVDPGLARSVFLLCYFSNQLILDELVFTSRAMFNFITPSPKLERNERVNVIAFYLGEIQNYYYPERRPEFYICSVAELGVAFHQTRRPGAK